MERERSAAAAMLGMSGFVVLAVSDFDGELEQAIETAADLVACPECGAVAELHDRRPCWVRDLPCAGRPVTLVWIKRVWRCRHALCPKRTWTETSELIAPRASLTERARAEICRRVGEDGASVAATAREFGVGWGTAMAAVRDHGSPRVDDPDRLDGVSAVGLDETAFQAASATRSTSFVTGIVDLTRGPGRARLLDVVADRSASALVSWLNARDPEWQAGVTTAALDPYRGYASALRTSLPHAVRVLDAFHVVRHGRILRTLPLTGAAARTMHLNAALHAAGCPTTLLLCDLNPDSRPSTRWPLPVEYVDFADVYGDPARLIASLTKTAPDVLVMSNTELTVRYGRAAADATDAALVYEMHDDEAAMLASVGSPPADCRTASLLQGAAVAAADGVIAFSHRDAARARALGADQVHLVPCGAPSTELQPTLPTSAHTSPDRVAFVGNLHYEPNLRALRYLAQQLAPHLHGRAAIDVFGRYPAAARIISAAASSDVLTLHGPVGNLQGALSQMTLAVAPLDSGGGMKLKTLDHLAAGLPIVATPEAVAGLDHPERFALLSHDIAMRDLPELIDRLLADPELRHRLGANGRDAVSERYSWHLIARDAYRAYQAIAATRAAHGPYSQRRDHLQMPREVIELAWRTPYWLAEWRSRDPRLQDYTLMADQANHTPEQHEPHRPGSRNEVGDLAEAIDCARLAATAALDITFDADAAAGYAGRSMVFFAPQAVLKVYTHRATERAQREITGIAMAAAHAPHLRIAEILGHDDVPGGLSWVSTTRLSGAQPTSPDLTAPACADELGRVAARLHAIPAALLKTLPHHTRRIRDLPAGDDLPANGMAAIDIGHALAAALNLAEPHQRPRCEHGFVHGDLSSRNILLATDHHPAVIDFEGSGASCIYDDLATLVMQDGLLGPADPDDLITGYESERAALGHPDPAIDHGHLALHLGRRARWILQWAIEIDPPLTEQVRTLAPALLTDLARQRPEETR